MALFQVHFQPSWRLNIRTHLYTIGAIGGIVCFIFITRAAAKRLKVYSDSKIMNHHVEVEDFLYQRELNEKRQLNRAQK
jgi:hypothetical protein